MELDPPTLQIRGARVLDVARVTRCYLAARRTLTDYAPLPHTDAEVMLWVRDTLLPGGGVTVALEAGTVVGFIAVAERDGATWVDQLWVHPSRMRRGIGSILLHLVLSRVAGPVRLHTFEPNRGARRFCERHGFHAVGFSDGSGSGSPCPDVLYERMVEPVSDRG
jgi:GNAT superfamily N-acetyltransferase